EKIGTKQKYRSNIGTNLEGQSSIFKKGDTSYTLMDHDLEDRVLTVEERKKRARGESEDILAKAENNTLALSNRRVGDANIVISTAAKRQVDRSQ
ncbi:hypothetical protein Goarm_009944, partial [Gossypium armourianum]|nr:hypothetical protein [Gossypium armourianum]